MSLVQDNTGWVCTVCGRYYTNTEHDEIKKPKPVDGEFDKGNQVTTPAAICDAGLCNVVKIDE